VSNFDQTTGDPTGTTVDLWEPAELEDTQAERIVVYDLRDRSEVQTGRDTRHEKSEKALRPLAMFCRRLVQPLVDSSRTAKHERSYSRHLIDNREEDSVGGMFHSFFVKSWPSGIFVSSRSHPHDPPIGRL
jgi:hypothetical protein